MNKDDSGSKKSKLRLVWLSLRKTFKDVDQGTSEDNDLSRCTSTFTLIVCGLPILGILLTAFVLLFFTIMQVIAQLTNVFSGFECQINPLGVFLNKDKDKEGKCLLMGMGTIVGITVGILFLIGLFHLFKSSKKNYLKLMEKVDV